MMYRVLAVCGVLCTMVASAELTKPLSRPSLQVMYLQDLSSEFTDNLPAIKQGVMSSMDAIMAAHESPTQVSFGLGTFIDRPIAPYGGSDDYCFRLRHPLTDDVSVIERNLNRTITRDGGDRPNCQLTALAESVHPSDRALWNSQDGVTTKIVVMITASPFHQRGDFVIEGISADGKPSTQYAPAYVSQHPYDVASVLSIDKLQARQEALNHMDYPSTKLVGRLLRSRGVTPVFLVPHSLAKVYRDLVFEFQRGYVYEIDFDADRRQHAAEEDEDVSLASLISETIQLGVDRVMLIETELGCDSEGRCPCEDGYCGEALLEDEVINYYAVPQNIKFVKSSDKQH